MQSEPKVNRYYGDGEKAEKTNSHIVVCVSHTDRKSYYIDLTGAQFGRHDGVTLASEYRNAHVKETSAVAPLGKCKKELDCAVSNPFLATVYLGEDEDHRLELIGHDAAARMYADLQTFLQGLGPMTLKEVLRAKTDDFHSMRDSLIKTVGDGLKSFV
jgi:hypothetical protein